MSVKLSTIANIAIFIFLLIAFRVSARANIRQMKESKKK